jgi:hypothetical protein
MLLRDFFEAVSVNIQKISDDMNQVIRCFPVHADATVRFRNRRHKANYKPVLFICACSIVQIKPFLYLLSRKTFAYDVSIISNLPSSNWDMETGKLFSNFTGADFFSSSPIYVNNNLSISQDSTFRNTK